MNELATTKTVTRMIIEGVNNMDQKDLELIMVAAIRAKNKKGLFVNWNFYFEEVKIGGKIPFFAE